ncbi:hypothetical protein VNO78_03569 [Psophocarpus tetragonolobus]|uniref:HMA domain-containing protein n=1 Tax=Psophocarpus tetragonolobus TaxID=3891 RepID=A0AAN9TDH1_PSOTE
MMSLKSSKVRMRNGLMCFSEASTAVCMSNSVFVPRSRSLDDTRLINHAKYSKLVHSNTSSSSFYSANNKCGSVSLPNINKRSHDQVNESRELHKMPKDNVFQVVVMRVAIYCQGCAGKVKKHLSKMEGVTSFSIDVESKRVTVMGHISPVGVLESISKVKRAEFWNC